MSKYKLDKVDAYILNALQTNARTTNTDIAKELKMVPSAILERIKRLENKGFIKNYQAILDHDLIELGLLAFMFVKVEAPSWDSVTSESFSKIPNVLDVYEVTGEWSYLLKFRVKDMDDYSKVVKEELNKVEHVTLYNSIIVSKSIK